MSANGHAPQGPLLATDSIAGEMGTGISTAQQSSSRSPPVNAGLGLNIPSSSDSLRHENIVEPSGSSAELGRDVPSSFHSDTVSEDGEDVEGSDACSEDLQNVRAFAKLIFADSTHFMRTLTLELGRDRNVQNVARMEDACDLLVLPIHDPQNFQQKSTGISAVQEVAQNSEPQKENEALGTSGELPTNQEAAQPDNITMAASMPVGSPYVMNGESKPTVQFASDVDDTEMPDPNQVVFLGLHEPKIAGEMVGAGMAISRKHLRIQYNDDLGVWELHILGKNGAFHNGNFVARNTVHELQHGTRIQVHNVVFHFELPNGDEAESDLEGSMSGSRMSFGFEDRTGESIVAEALSDDSDSCSFDHAFVEPGEYLSGSAEGEDYDELSNMDNNGIDEEEDDIENEDNEEEEEEEEEDIEDEVEEEDEEEEDDEESAEERPEPQRIKINLKSKQASRKSNAQAKQAQKKAEKKALAVAKAKAAKEAREAKEAAKKAKKLKEAEKKTNKKKPPAKDEDKATSSKNPNPDEASQQDGPKDGSEEGRNGVKDGSPAVPRITRDEPMQNGAGITIAGLPEGVVIPARRRGPGRPPKDGLMSKREKNEILKKFREENKAREEGIDPSTIKFNEIKKPARPRKNSKGEDIPDDPESKVADEKAKKAVIQKPPRSPSPEMRIEDYTEEQLVRPDQNYIVLIHEAISNSKTGSLNLQQLYSAIERKYPYFKFKTGSSGWQSSVRHNLQQSPAFAKGERDGKGFRWVIVEGVPIEKEKKKKPPQPQLPPSFPSYSHGPLGQHSTGPHSHLLSHQGQPHAPIPHRSLIPQSLATTPAARQHSYSSPYASNTQAQLNQPISQMNGTSPGAPAQSSQSITLPQGINLPTTAPPSFIAATHTPLMGTSHAPTAASSSTHTGPPQTALNSTTLSSTNVNPTGSNSSNNNTLPAAQANTSTPSRVRHLSQDVINTFINVFVSSIASKSSGELSRKEAHTVAMNGIRRVIEPEAMVNVKPARYELDIEKSFRQCVERVLHTGEEKSLAGVQVAGVAGIGETPGTVPAATSALTPTPTVAVSTGQTASSSASISTPMTSASPPLTIMAPTPAVSNAALPPRANAATTASPALQAAAAAAAEDIAVAVQLPVSNAIPARSAPSTTTLPSSQRSLPASANSAPNAEMSFASPPTSNVPMAPMIGSDITMQDVPVSSPAKVNQTPMTIPLVSGPPQASTLAAAVAATLKGGGSRTDKLVNRPAVEPITPPAGARVIADGIKHGDALAGSSAASTHTGDSAGTKRTIAEVHDNNDSGECSESKRARVE